MDSIGIPGYLNIQEILIIFNQIKRLFKHSAVYGVGHIVSRSIHFLLLPFYTHILTPAQYGVVGLMFTYIAVLTIIYTYGLDAAFFRFHILEDDPEKRKRVFSTAFFTLSVSSIIFTVAIALNAESIAGILFSKEVQELPIQLPKLIRWASGILLFDSVAFLPFLMLRAEERSRSFVLYKIANVLLTVCTNIIFVGVLHLGLEGIFLANFISSAVTFLMLGYIILKSIRLSFSKNRLKELLLFGLPYIPLNLSFIIMDTIDRPFLERLSGIREAGLYNAGVKLGMFMALFVAAFRFAWTPFFLSTAKKEGSKKIFSRVLTYVILACFLVFLIISFFIDNIVRFSIFGYSLVGEYYWDSTLVVPVIMFAYILYAIYNNFLIGIYLKKKTAYLPLIAFAGMVVNLIANYILIPEIGMMGAAYARVLAYLIMAVILFIVSQRLYPIDYEWRRIIKICFIVGGENTLNTDITYAAYTDQVF
jgi:O-antigen/teichoic acid export membrane protein